MMLAVKFLKEDRGNSRTYYKGMGNQHGYLYCLQENTWYFCSRDGEPESPLKEGLELKIHEPLGVINNIVIKSNI